LNEGKEGEVEGGAITGGKVEEGKELPNINRTQAAERAENSVLCPW